MNYKELRVELILYQYYFNTIFILNAQVKLGYFYASILR